MIQRLKAWLRHRLATQTRHGRSCFGQFGEDVCLQNYFAAKAWRENGRYGDYDAMPAGFYVDVGANDPVLNSNTHWFYERGWNGINVDALPAFKAYFDSERERDVNIHAAVSDEEKDVVFYAWPDQPVFSTVSPELARERSEKLGKPEEVRLRTRRLETILAQHLPAGQQIDFLSVDVEGHDLAVLRSNDWVRYRPELVVVESDERRVEGVMGSDMTVFMAEHDYRVGYWIQPSVIFVDGRG